MPVLRACVHYIDIFTEHVNDIDAVILDFMMPDLNGKETFEKLKDLLFKMFVLIPSIFLYRFLSDYQ